VQNRNPSQNHPSKPSFLDQAFARALARIDAERPPRGSAPDTSEDDDSADSAFLDPLLDGADLLAVMREPVEWVLALAYRLADAEPVDVAAVTRLSDAFHARLAGKRAGVHKTDLLIVFGLLVGALDPAVVVRAVSDTIGDGIAAVLGADAPVAIHVTGTVDPFGELVGQRRPSAGRRWSCSVRSRLVR
jgi:hypothetical protein